MASLSSTALSRTVSLYSVCQKIDDLTLMAVLPFFTILAVIITRALSFAAIFPS